MTKPKAKREAPEKSISSFPPVSTIAKKLPKPVVRTRPDGYFTELIRKHNWPPMWESSWEASKNQHLAAATTQSRAVQVSTGVGWGLGTVVMANTPKNERPAWLHKAKT